MTDLSSTTIDVAGELEILGTDPGPGVSGFRLVEFTGWDDAPPADGEALKKLLNHGLFPSPVFRDARLILASGWALAADETEMWQMQNAMTGVLGDGAEGVLTVDQYGVSTWATVQVWGDAQFRRQGSSLRALWVLNLRATDMRKYGAAVSEGPGASLTVGHAGNFPAIPTVTVTGPQSAPYTVASQGHSVTVTQALGSGEEHLIDMETGWVYLDGDLQTGATSALDVFTIPKGDPVAVTGPASMVVELADTYI